MADVEDDGPASPRPSRPPTRAAAPTARLTAVEAAYWTDVATKEHLRWVMPEPEDQLLDALARLHAAGDDEPSGGRPRFVGHVPRPRAARPGLGPAGRQAGPEPLSRSPAERVRGRLAEALADDSPLTGEQRAARSGLANRQVTIR